MEGSNFDDLAKRLSATTTRREAVRLLGGALAAGALGALLPGRALAAKGGNSTCAQFCATTFGADTPAAKQCAADAAHGQGLCYSACGPLGTGGGTLIGGTCCPSANVCGSTCLAAPCNVCGSTCVSGTCVCPTGTVQLTNGTCAILCPLGGSQCPSGRCVSTSEGNICSTDNGFGSCSNNLDGPTGSFCNGLFCEHAC